MRKQFAKWLKNYMDINPNVWLIVPDYGYGTLDELKDHERFVNVGIAEQLAMLTAIGLALSGKKVYIYSIATFILYRAFEQIRTYVDRLKLDITIVGVGKDMTYKAMDYAHWAIDDVPIMRNLKNFNILDPFDEVSMNKALEKTITEYPNYVRLA